MTQSDDWRIQNEKLRRSFDTVADRYAAEFLDELDRKPFDRELLDTLAARLRGRRVLEVGGGPGHIGDYLGARGVDVVLSDISTGQLQQSSSTRRLVCDLARLPIRPGSLDGILAFYCLIYGPPDPLDDVFAEWRGALMPDGIAITVVHAGDGFIRADEWWDRPVDLHLVFRDPDDFTARLQRAGFEIEQSTVRPPYDDEYATDRHYVVARRVAD